MAHHTPNFERLVALASGELPAAEAARIESELARDPDAARSLATLRRVIDSLRRDDSVELGPEAMARTQLAVRQAAARVLGASKEAAAESSRFAPGIRWWEGLVEHLARAVHELRDGPASAALPGFRGASSGHHQVFVDDSGGGAEIDIQITPVTHDSAPTGRQRWRLNGQIDVQQEPRHESSSARSARLAIIEISSGAVVADLEVDATGYFSALLEAGAYELRIEREGSVLVLRTIDVP